MKHLGFMAVYISRSHAVRALTDAGVSHKSALVRAATATMSRADTVLSPIDFDSGFV
jgi:hypothetical protein